MTFLTSDVIAVIEEEFTISPLVETAAEQCQEMHRLR